MTSTVAIIDYGSGNVQSIKNALKKFDIEVILSYDRSVILNADGVILPGVGAFKKAMNQLSDRGLDVVIRDFENTGKPFLGVCLGMQLLFESSEEFGVTDGLGVIKGKVIRLPVSGKNKLPHISWGPIEKADVSWKNTILENITNNEDLYFVHSYICVPDSKQNILATAEYGAVTFCAAVNKKNIYGCQFHPEKSAESGLKIIKEFVKLLNI
jgi:imidazole glycerol-phosphate synthase subunit HisH